MKTIELAALAKTASRSVRLLDNEVRSSILNAFADNLLNGQESILTANDQDIAAARAEGRTDAFLDRLRLTPERIAGMAQGVREIAAMADPLGRVLEKKTIRSGVRLVKKTVPMGVIGITLAMVVDWAVKTVLILVRWKSGKWKEYRVI